MLSTKPSDTQPNGRRSLLPAHTEPPPLTPALPPFQGDPQRAKWGRRLLLSLSLGVLCSLCALLFSPSPPVHAQSSDGLVDYWPFDKGNGDASGDRAGNDIRFRNSDGPLHGNLDEVGIDNRALSDSAMQSLAFTCASVSEIPQAECQALVALYASTNGDQWSDNNGWLRNNTPCKWDGVTCHEGSVRWLGLFFNNLSGTIPPELGNLTNLQFLLLNDNELSGTIPPELGNLINLQELRLSSNQLSGTIPPELGSLTNLRVLWLENNQLRGSIPATLCGLPIISINWRYNKLLDADPCLAEKDPDSTTTQTVPPLLYRRRRLPTNKSR